MSRSVEVVGSVADAARTWHLTAGTIIAARFGVKLTPKPRPGQAGREDRKVGERESAS